jgi:HSP20 family molecular chaperone IbpA
MHTLPDIKRSPYASQLQLLEPPVTIRKRPWGCLVQVDCPRFSRDELAFDLNEDHILLSGHPLNPSHDPAAPSRFEHRIPLGFDTSRSRVKSVYLDGVFSVLLQNG